MVLLELIHKFLNIIAPPLTLINLLLFLPPYQIIKYFLSIFDSFFSEDVAGKVVIITGASSGIGEDIHFWGSVYMTSFAIPYLKNSEGRIVVLSSSASWMPTPKMSLYCASKAAMTLIFEALRIEFGRDIKITLVTPGFVESEMTQGKYIDETGKVVVKPQMRDVIVGIAPVVKVEDCAKAIVNGACRGKRYVTVPAWFTFTYLWQVFCPEVVEWILRLFYLTGPGASPEDALSKKILDYTGLQRVLYPENIRELKPKTK